MVLNLFAGAGAGQRRDGSRRRADFVADTPRRDGLGARYSQRRTPRRTERSVQASTAEDRELFVNCVAQVQRSLKTHADSPSTLHTLGSYYTKVEPYIDNRPFCVSLSFATFLFHLQMARISVGDVELYVQLIANVLSQLTEDEQLRHPFVQQVLRDHVFGLPSPTCRGGAHCVVLTPPQQYRAFATLTTSLLALDVVPLDIVYQFQDRLEFYCNANSPLIANRALALLVQTVTQIRLDEQVTALQYVLKTKPNKMNVDFLIACYERMKRVVVDPANGPGFTRALAIHCSELFLRFRSPVRREYVERFLYPSLCQPDMRAFLEIPATRLHLLRELLAQCTPDMGVGNPFFMCLCALLQPGFDDEIDGALETVTLINCRMPHAAYFMSALAVDTHMSVSMFAKIMIALARGAGLAMTGREVPDEVATSINRSRTSVYNVLFVLREVVRSCSITASRRATDMLKALRVAVPLTSIEALGKLSSEAFDGQCDITVDPQLLCAELAMVLHQEHIVEAVESAVDYFKDVTQQCNFCGMQRSASLLCPVNGTVHVTGQSSVSRVLSTLSECAGAKVLEERLIQYLRDPATQMDGAVHVLIYHILANAGQHRSALFVAIEPYLRSTLMALVSADRGSARGLVGSEQKANVLMLHVKVVTLLASSIDPSYLESIVKVFAELKLRNNHDALALWYMANTLLRNSKGNLDLLPTDPQESNYCVDFPGCAPASATCADNAQLVLKLLDRAHSFSREMRKLVGCCVCKLIQDFNMQATNITSTLLSSYGFVPVGLESLSEFALPVGAGSTFWSFFLQQMKSSAPARTAFMAALAKSIARRFRIATPADAVAPYGAETTGHLFSVMVYEAMKRNPPLARIVLYVMTHWMKQAGHAPGKFVCLVYICVQLIAAVVERGSGPAAVDLATETMQDQHQFDDCVKKAARLLQSQQPRLSKLLPAIQRDNQAFYYLVRRLQRKVRCTVAEANGEPVPYDDADTMEADEQDALGGSYVYGVNADDAMYDTYGDNSRTAQDSDSRLRDGAVSLRDLQHAADDSVFDEDVARNAAGDYDEYGEAAGGVPDPMEGEEGNGRGDHWANAPPLPLAASTSSSAPRAPFAVQLAELAEALRHSNAADDGGGAAAGEAKPASTPGSAGSHRVESAISPSTDASTVAFQESMTSSGGTVGRGNAAAHAINVDAENDGVLRGDAATAVVSHRPFLSTRSRSRGVQTDPEEEDDEEEDVDNDRGEGGGTRRRARVLQEQHPNTVPTSRSKRSVDKAVTVPFQKDIGTSPIQPDARSNEGDWHTPRPRPQQQQQQQPQGVPSGVSPMHTAAGSPRSHDYSARTQGSGGRVSTWNEPDLTAYVQGDATPIDDTELPYLQATAADGAVLPSGMVLEYLRTHQVMDSLRHELHQLDQRWVQEYVRSTEHGEAAREVAEQDDGRAVWQGRVMYPVTVEGRENNYGRPHDDPAHLAPSRTVLSAVDVRGTATRHTGPAPLASSSRTPPPPPSVGAKGADRSAEVVDGTHPITPVSSTAGGAADMPSRRRRMEEGEESEAVAGASAPPTPSAGYRGMNFFLNQHQAQNVNSALQDIHHLQRQKERLEMLGHHHQPEANASPPHSPRNTPGPGRENMVYGGGSGAAATPVASNVVHEGLPPTTPYGQVVIPACFVEQKNDTAIRELRQVMGAYNPNDTRLSLAGKQRIRGSGTVPQPTMTGAEGEHAPPPPPRDNAVWWAEMSAAPMPDYAADPQYSMELF